MCCKGSTLAVGTPGQGGAEAGQGRALHLRSLEPQRGKSVGPEGT